MPQHKAARHSVHLEYFRVERIYFSVEPRDKPARWIRSRWGGGGQRYKIRNKAKWRNHSSKIYVCSTVVKLSWFPVCAACEDTREDITTRSSSSTLWLLVAAREKPPPCTQVVKLIGLTVWLPGLLCELSFGLCTAMTKTRETTKTVRVCVSNDVWQHQSTSSVASSVWTSLKKQQLLKRRRQRVLEFTEFSLKCQKKTLFGPSLLVKQPQIGSVLLSGLFSPHCGPHREPGPHYLWPRLLWVVVSPTRSSSTTLT